MTAGWQPMVLNSMFSNGPPQARSEVERKLLRGILFFIEKERQGEAIHRPLLQSLLQMYAQHPKATQGGAGAGERRDGTPHVVRTRRCGSMLKCWIGAMIVEA